MRRLHPLVREYCARQLSLENPSRKRWLHSRIAIALAARDHILPALRHATSAGDKKLLAKLIERRGAYGFWLRDGAMGVAAVGRFLTPELVATYPRLGLLRCVHLQFSNSSFEAAALFEAVGRRTNGFREDHEDGDVDALVMDKSFAEVILSGGLRTSAESGFDALMRAGELPDRLTERDRLVASGWHLVHCLFNYRQSQFDESRRHGVRAQAILAGSMRYGEAIVTLYLGLIAMACGRADEAERHYDRARRHVRTFFPADLRLMASIDALCIELDLERHRARRARQRTLQGLSELRGVWNEGFIAAAGVRAELTFLQYENDAVIEYLTRTLFVARETGVRRLATYSALLLTYYLVRLQRTPEAEQVWRENSLPSEPSELFKAGGRSWRMMEALLCARVTLLGETGDLGAAAELADAGRRRVSSMGAVRVELRCLGLAMLMAYRAGDKARARARLVEMLRITRRVDYFRSFAESPDISRRLLEEFLATGPPPDLVKPARTALARLGREPSRVRVSPLGNSTSSRKSAAASETRKSREAWGFRRKGFGTTSGTSTERQECPGGSTLCATRNPEASCPSSRWQNPRGVRRAMHPV